MYDLESGVSPNEGCTGSLHTHKNPGWTSKRIRFGDAGIKGRSEDWLPPSRAQHRAGLRPSGASGRDEPGSGTGTGTAPLRRTVGWGTGGRGGGQAGCPQPRTGRRFSGKLLRRGRGCGTGRGVHTPPPPAGPCASSDSRGKLSPPPLRGTGDEPLRRALGRGRSRGGCPLSPAVGAPRRYPKSGSHPAPPPPWVSALRTPGVRCKLLPAASVLGSPRCPSGLGGEGGGEHAGAEPAAGTERSWLFSPSPATLCSKFGWGVGGPLAREGSLPAGGGRTGTAGAGGERDGVGGGTQEQAASLAGEGRREQAGSVPGTAGSLPGEGRERSRGRR